MIYYLTIFHKSFMFGDIKCDENNVQHRIEAYLALPEIEKIAIYSEPLKLREKKSNSLLGTR